MRIISLKYMAPQVMLVMEYPSRALYQEQTGSNSDPKRSIEGVLVPLALDIEVIRRIGPYPSVARGITSAIADSIDELLASDRWVEFLRVDPNRLSESGEAWIYVLVNSPDITKLENYRAQSKIDYFGPIYGFGVTKGVLTWVA